ncbi:E3 ubiquitin-protein ligase siah2-like [Coccinella septempunctata]|uniref:E3 ubiquitin-protein ligase siah2-like n=1 Tax=Coccinella septempunctata TaxID=41139 RepID=UPI001D070712|nr:E3 ubiquitin-protein ligase siah2-like [Coccinella septempunctata]
MEKIQQILKQQNNVEDSPLKCAVCKHYLSISPIVHNDILGSICGRDSCKKLAVSEGTNYRQKAYEELAKVLEFPCMYEENGCKEVLPWNEIGEHEIICEFLKFCCPFSTDHFEDEEKICTWEGNTTEILCHMEEVHSPHRFENYVQISLEQDIKKNKLLFSRIQDSIVLLLVIIGAESETYWKVWTVPEIWKNLNYKIEIS